MFAKTVFLFFRLVALLEENFGHKYPVAIEVCKDLMIWYLTTKLIYLSPNIFLPYFFMYTADYKDRLASSSKINLKQVR